MKHDRFERETLDEFEGFFEEDVKYSIAANLQASEAFNLSLLDTLFADIIEKLRRAEYKSSPGSFELEWGNALKAYEDQSRGPGKLSAINNFIIEHQNTAISGYFQSVIEDLNSEIVRLKNSGVEHNDKLARLNEQLKKQEDGEVRFQEQVYRIERELDMDNRDKTLAARLKDIIDKLSEAKSIPPPAQRHTSIPPQTPKQAKPQQKATPCCIMI